MIPSAEARHLSSRRRATQWAEQGSNGGESCCAATVLSRNTVKRRGENETRQRTRKWTQSPSSGLHHRMNVFNAVISDMPIERQLYVGSNILVSGKTGCTRLVAQPSRYADRWSCWVGNKRQATRPHGHKEVPPFANGARPIALAPSRVGRKGLLRS